MQSINRFCYYFIFCHLPIHLSIHPFMNRRCVTVYSGHCGWSNFHIQTELWTNDISRPTFRRPPNGWLCPVLQTCPLQSWSQWKALIKSYSMRLRSLGPTCKSTIVILWALWQCNNKVIFSCSVFLLLLLLLIIIIIIIITTTLLYHCQCFRVYIKKVFKPFKYSIGKHNHFFKLHVNILKINQGWWIACMSCNIQYKVCSQCCYSFSLVCAVSYSSPSGEKMFFRKFYKFQVKYMHTVGSCCAFFIVMKNWML